MVQTNNSSLKREATATAGWSATNMQIFADRNREVEELKEKVRELEKTNKKQAKRIRVLEGAIEFCKKPRR